MRTFRACICYVNGNNGKEGLITDIHAKSPTSAKNILLEEIGELNIISVKMTETTSAVVQELRQSVLNRLNQRRAS